jgi:D-tyrosyl-tRNA(Tyr) deacylase
MRFLIQRVRSASVSVDDHLAGAIDHGLLILVGIGHGDTPQILDRMIDKAIGLRIFEDDAGKMNVSVAELNAERPGSAGILLVSQFTLYADCRKGRRPSFTDSALPDQANQVMNLAVERFAATGIPTASGQFGAHMVVKLENDGPVTIWLDSAELFPLRD